ncbi:acyltransferase [Pseudomonas entomophila]|uniref:acyltransferase family protein n=1 Tax=Pseudomonas entomophila TaxID=312306 RepID=UPI0015E2C140|nr:acyltransferase [Pseudomonas entomophila]MBA1195423.1 acyltransferase [Pseudomonas entomophila]
MGILRFLLAALVVVSHMAYTVQGLNPGVWAVVIFYILAGHVVAKLWANRPYEKLRDSILWFYKDRSLRIFPLYFAALAFGAAVWGLGAKIYFLSARPDFSHWLANFTVVPLSYYMWNGMDQFTILPPAWSLGVELQFYLLVPLLMLSSRVAIFAIFASVMVFIAAQIGWLNTDVFGYRIILGVLFIFLTGAAIENGSKLGRLFVTLAWFSMFLYIAALWKFDIRRSFDFEVALGYVLGVPLVAGLSKVKFSGGFNFIQRQAGNVSYGLFLFHFPSIWLAESVGLSAGFKVAFVFSLSIVLAIICHHLVERPFWKRFRSVVNRSPATHS